MTELKKYIGRLTVCLRQLFDVPDSMQTGVYMKIASFVVHFQLIPLNV